MTTTCFPLRFFIRFMRHDIARISRPATADGYRAALRSFSSLASDRHISPTSVRAYVQTLESRSLSRNTINFYLSRLAASFSRMAPEAPNPFRMVRIAPTSTRKRALSPQQMRRIINVPLTNDADQRARNILILSVLMMGISFVDLAFLRKDTLRGNTVTYERRKSGARIVIELNDTALHLIARYRAPDSSPYLLDILSGSADNEWLEYRCALRHINGCLKRVARHAGITIPLSTYNARHTWATLARDQSVNLSIISRALGHTSIATTEIYLNSIDDGRIAHANVLVATALSLNRRGKAALQS